MKKNKDIEKIVKDLLPFVETYGDDPNSWSYIYNTLKTLKQKFGQKFVDDIIEKLSIESFKNKI